MTTLFSNLLANQNVYTGRSIIYTDVDEQIGLTDPSIVLSELKLALPKHNINASQISFLMDYYKGTHAILKRKKQVRDDIDNKIVINYAQAATRDIVGYYLGKAITYTARKEKRRKQVAELLDISVYENKDTVDYEIAHYQSICGTGYKGVFPDVVQDEVPFNLACLNPLTTFVAYSTGLGNRPVWCCSYYARLQENGTATLVYTVWDKNRSWVIAVPDGQLSVEGARIGAPKMHKSGGLPIVEYPNNQWRLGDWETSISLMDSIDTVASDSVNDVSQFVQSFLAIIGAELPEPEVDADGNITSDPLTKMKEDRVIQIVPAAAGGGHIDIKYLSNTLDASNVSNLREYLESSLRVVLGVPDRKTRGGGGGDTGDAVYMRDGWQDIDLVASNKEMFAIKAEKEAIRVMINLATASNSSTIKDLSIRDIDVKFSRTKSSNIMAKTQAYSTIVGTQTITPEDALVMVDLTTDEGEVVQRGEAYYDKKAQKYAESTIDNAGSETVTQSEGQTTNSKGTNDERNDGSTTNE